MEIDKCLLEKSRLLAALESNQEIICPHLSQADYGLLVQSSESELSAMEWNEDTCNLLNTALNWGLMASTKRLARALTVNFPNIGVSIQIGYPEAYAGVS